MPRGSPVQDESSEHVERGRVPGMSERPDHRWSERPCNDTPRTSCRSTRVGPNNHPLWVFKTKRVDLLTWARLEDWFCDTGIHEVQLPVLRGFKSACWIQRPCNDSTRHRSTGTRVGPDDRNDKCGRKSKMDLSRRPRVARKSCRPHPRAWMSDMCNRRVRSERSRVPLLPRAR
jgi:hypothetical protein